MAYLTKMKKEGNILTVYVNHPDCEDWIYTLVIDVEKCEIISAVGDNGKDFSNNPWTWTVVYNLYNYVKEWGENIPEKWTLAWL